jgi:hypothetical protein
MPRENYPCKVYRVINDVDDLVYVGSTANMLAKRWGSHKAAAKKLTKTGKLQVHIRELGVRHFRIVLLHEFEARNMEHQRQVEQEYIVQLDSLKNGLNGVRAHQTPEQRAGDRKEYDRRYIAGHKDVLAERDRRYYENNKDAIVERQRRYQAEHKDAIAEKRRQYNDEHKDAIAVRRNEKIDCFCGAKVARGGIRAHQRSAKHHRQFEAKTLAYIYA